MWLPKVSSIFNDNIMYKTTEHYIFDINSWPRLMDTKNIGIPFTRYESDTEYLVELELPGIKIDMIDLRVENNTLTVKVDVKTALLDDFKVMDTASRLSGQLLTGLHFTTPVKHSDINAIYKDGILTIHLAKTQLSNNKISIKTY